MPWFESTHSETRTLPHPLDRVRAHFANPSTVLAHTKGIQTSRVEDDVIHVVLKEEDHGVVKYQGEFRCRYELDGSTLRWTTVGEGNYRQTGHATFREDGETTVMEYEETVGVDLDVPAMVAPMIKPVIGAMLSSEIKDYVKRVSAAL